MILICTSHDLIEQSAKKELADIELVDLAFQVNLIFKSDVIVIYHSGLFKFLKCKTDKETRLKYKDIFKVLGIEDDILPEFDFSKAIRNDSRLYNTASKDALKCTVGFEGPSCFHVQNAVRVLGSVDQVALELGIPLNAVCRALDYAELYPYQDKTGE